MLLVNFFDFICKKFGRSFFIIFKIIIPFLAMLVPIDQMCKWLMISSSKVTALILYACFLAMLIFVPKIASVVEFIVIGLAFILCFSLGSVTHLFGWIVMIFAGIFLFFKVLFFLAMLIKQANSNIEMDSKEWYAKFKFCKRRKLWLKHLF